MKDTHPKGEINTIKFERENYVNIESNSENVLFIRKWANNQNSQSFELYDKKF